MNFLSDTGAAFSVLPFRLGPLDSLTKMVMGVYGKPQSRNFTKPPSIVRWATGKEPTPSYTSLVALLPYWGETFFAASKPE